MRPLTGELLLDAWQRGAAEAGLMRPLSLLALACADRPSGDWADLSVAELNIELLRLRRITFGDALRGCLPCGACGSTIEFETSVSAMLDLLESLRPREKATWESGSAIFSMRPATSRDLAAIASAADPRRGLLARCLLVDSDAGEALLACEDQAIEQFNRLNQGAETRFALPCAACGAAEHADLDIGRFLWAELRHAAVNLLRDVHDLASAYGWSERSILAMNARRRAVYLEMARA